MQQKNNKMFDKIGTTFRYRPLLQQTAYIY